MWQMWNTPQILQKWRCCPCPQSQSSQPVVPSLLPPVSCRQRMEGSKLAEERPTKSKKFQKIFGSVAPTNPPDVGPFFTSDASLLEPLQQGALFSSWSEDGSSVNHVFVTLDPLNHRLALDWRRGVKATSEISVMDLKLVVENDAPKDMKSIERNLLSTSEITEANFFTLCYGQWPWEELHLTSDHLHLVQTWVRGLEALIEACRSDSQTKHNAHGSVYLLQCCYLKLFRKHGDWLSPTDALKEFAQVKQWKAKQMAYDILVDDHSLLQQLLHDGGKLLFASFHAFYLNFAAKRTGHLLNLYQRYAQNGASMQRSQTSKLLLPSFGDEPSTLTNGHRRRRSVEAGFMGLMDRFTGSSPNTTVKKMATTATFCPRTLIEDATDKAYMTLAAFRDFLVKTQRVEGVGSLNDAFEIISKCDPLSESLKEGLDKLSEVTVIPPRSFAAYMLSAEGNAVGFARTRGVYQDMTRPLTDYFISSSHNTYLSGHQLHGESSVNMYTTVLSLGCRCVELDCWDGDNGQPIIHHGHTLVTKISFEQVMVKVMKRELGHLLLTETIDGCCSPARLPSPEELKYKILIKHKKVPQEESSGRASAEPAHSTVDIMPVQLDSLPMSPTRSKAQGSRRASVPGRLSVPASVLVGFGKEKKTGNKKRLQQRRSCEGSSRSSSDPLSPAQADPQTRTEERGSLGEGAMALTPSPESEGEVSKQPSFEDFKLSPGKRKPPLLRQDSSLSVTSTTSDDCFTQTPGSSLPGKPPKKSNELKKKLTWLVSSKKKRRVEDRGEEYGIPRWICMVMSESNDQATCSLSQSLDLGLLHQRRNGCDVTGEDMGSSPTEHVSKFTRMLQFRNRSHSVQPDNFLDVEGLMAQKSDSTAHRTSVEGKGLTSRKSSVFSDNSISANRRGSQTSEASTLGSLSPYLWTKGYSGLKDSIGEDNAFDSPKEPSVSPPQRESPAPGKKSSSGYMDTVETACTGKSIARELSDIVVYLEPLKFFSFKNANWRAMRCTEMFSMSEAAAKKAAKKTPFELTEYCSRHFSRIYPAATRINSANFSPGQFWMHGCQMVALNYQSNDSAMQHNMGLFQLNNNSGYILKPTSLHARCSHYYLTDSQDNDLVTKFTITFIAAENLLPASSGTNSSSTVLPVVEVELTGAPAECYKFKMTATEYQGETAVWSQNNTMAFSLLFPEIAIIRFSTAHDSMAYPIQSLQSGYRYIYLASEGKMASPKVPYIFVRISIESPSAAAANMESEPGGMTCDDEDMDKMEASIELTEEEQREEGIPVPQEPTASAIIQSLTSSLQLEGDAEEEDQHSVSDILQCLVATQMSSPQADQGEVSGGSQQQTASSIQQKMDHRGISWEDSVHEPAEVKKRKKWLKSSKGSQRWSCPEGTPNSPSSDVPTGETQSASRPSRFSFLRKSLARTRKEDRRLKKHTSCDDLLEGNSREEAHPVALHSVAVKGAEESARSSQWVESNDGTQGQVHRRAVSHDDLLHRVALDYDPSTCSIATETSTGEVHAKSQPRVEDEGSAVQWRRRLKRMWDSLKAN